MAKDLKMSQRPRRRGGVLHRSTSCLDAAASMSLDAARNCPSLTSSWKANGAESLSVPWQAHEGARIRRGESDSSDKLHIVTQTRLKTGNEA